LGISDNDWPTEGAGVGDFDSNGFVDVYLANYESEGQYKKDQLFLNMGSGNFLDLSDSLDAVLQGEAALAGRGVNPGDFDNDGDLDIYVSNYRLNRNYLWVNDGEGNFTEEALVRGVSGEEKEGWWGHTIGSEWADYNNDGNLDLITANLAHPRYIDISDKTLLYRNSGAPEFIFTDQRATVGIRFEETHSEPAWGDLNNDGYLDLYLNDVYENRRSFLYVNDQGKSFKDVTYLAGLRYFNGWGVAFADIDNDGDLDILSAGEDIKLFRNDTPVTGNWVEFKVTTKNHSDGIGTRLTLYNEDFLQIREVQGGKGTTNQHALVQHFGIGSSDPPFTLKIRFPSGREETAVIWEVNTRFEIQEIIGADLFSNRY
ncbi:MAG: CRTAC1 family protein, partial [Candidatus Cloacimonetes bacterium]|nr:CRTAC1 family protein [Candidatus Cloacimonadota bacterium]